MSILLLVLFVATVFIYFYQSIVVKTNNQLCSNDLDLLEHKLDLYKIKKRGKENISESQNIEEVKLYINNCKKIIGVSTFTGYMYAIKNMTKSDENEVEQMIKDRKTMEVSTPELMKLHDGASNCLFRNAVMNAGIFLFILSPLIFLIIVYNIVAGKTISIKKKIDDFSSIFCLK